MLGFSKKELGNRLLSLIQGNQWAGSQRGATKEDVFVIDVDLGRIVTVQDFKRGMMNGIQIETYGQQLPIDLPSFFH